MAANIYKCTEWEGPNFRIPLVCFLSKACIFVDI